MGLQPAWQHEAVRIASHPASFGRSTHDGLMGQAASLDYLRKCVDPMAEGRGEADKGKAAASRRREAMRPNQVERHVRWSIPRLAPLLALQGKISLCSLSPTRDNISGSR